MLSTPAREMRKLSDQRLGKLAGTLGAPGIEVQTLSTESHNPARAVLEIAKEEHADLIVAGTQSKSGLSRLLLGSTAEQIIRNSECPVLTVGPKVPSPADAPLVFRPIVNATDFSV